MNLTLDITDLPEEAIREIFAAALPLASSTSQLSVTIFVDANNFHDIANAVVGKTVAEQAEVVTPPPAENDNTPVDDTPVDLPEVKRRTKQEIGAGLSTDQAAAFRASGYENPVKWLDATGQQPGDFIPQEPEVEVRGPENDNSAGAEEEIPEASDDNSTEIPEVDYDTLKALVLENVKASFKGPTIRIAEEVFGVKTFRDIEDPANWGRAYALLSYIKEKNGRYPPDDVIAKYAPEEEDSVA